MTYEVIIKILNQVEYKGLFNLHNGKVYIRSLIDKDSYESMFKQLIDEGYVNTERLHNSNDYNINLIQFHNDLENIFDEISNRGIDISFNQVANDDYTFSVIADGEDLNPQVIAYLNKGTKIISLSENLFKYANNVNYEPKINIRASSYAVDVQEVTNDDTKLINLIDSINEHEINVQEYLNNTFYSNIINSLFDVVGIETLKTLKIQLRNGALLNLNINTIKNLKRNFKQMLSSSDFIIENINSQNNLRAFDDKKYRVILDISPTYYLHLNSENLYIKLKKAYEVNKNINIKGNYKGKQTIVVTEITIL